ncbi:MAG: RNA polymerase subunit sigma-70 [Actinomycetota bacterium]|nr:RNA polymerase subunit sigma-70 [Actinomycetota bacterium]
MRFTPALVYEAARLYYLEDANQAVIAERLGTSRTTVSRLLSEARSSGVVQVTLRDPTAEVTSDLGRELVSALRLKGAYVVASAPDIGLGRLMAPAVGAALGGARLNPGDALLVSSGATLHAVARERMPSLSGVVLCPTVGGVEEPEPHYQTNEITRALALKVGGIPIPLHAPAMPTRALYAVLMKDTQIAGVRRYWRTARAALLGVGGPPNQRSSLPGVISLGRSRLPTAVGDICARPFDAAGRPLVFPGSDRLVAMELGDLRRVPHTIGVAVGAEKVPAILAATRAGWINTVVTDVPTAHGLIAEARRAGGQIG